MNRLVLFLLGALAGGVAVYCLCTSGILAHGIAYRGYGEHMPHSAGVAPARATMAVPEVSTTIDSTAPSIVRENFAPVQPGVDRLPRLGSVEGSPAEPAPAMDTAMAIPISPGSLLIPVQGVQAGQLNDTYTQSRGAGRSHDAIDIAAARGTPVLAVDDGRVAKLFTSVPGGLTVYQFDRQEKIAYYYAHLDAYASGVLEGKQLKRGELVGYVGSTGNASPDGPHLHFAVFVLGPEKKWWQGTAVNPFPLLGGHRVQAP